MDNKALSLIMNTFGLINTISDTIFDMIVNTYHDKALIFSKGNISGGIGLPSSGNEK